MNHDSNPNEPTPDPFPRSIAIAGAWGYIGRKFFDVALARNLSTYVLDPGPTPDDLPPGPWTRVDDVEAFHRLDVDLFHLAVHPEHRRVDLLLGRREPLLILNEKPMAEPSRPDHCRRIVEAVDQSPAIMLYDFPELFDPLTARIVAHLDVLDDVRIDEIFIQRSKDREDPSNRRNDKRMVPIQYQESVHCLAFALHVGAAVNGGIDRLLDGGIRVEGESSPYVPPNPEIYPHVVDGRCAFRADLGGVSVRGLTDFKRGAPWAKRRIVRGTAGDRPFEIDASYLEGAKSLRIDGVDQPCDPVSNSYEHVLATAARWARVVGRDTLMNGLYPNPRFTHLTYQLSAALWRSCLDRAEVRFDSMAELLDWDANFAAELPRLPRYGEPSP